ncbi:hypothetical protein BDQ94DRAFT_132718 [Aspergillus welwitschiae]|uniref:Uncharacterized protein n=1 Tax=Aspergillus welwitschiae TaxID=1341132 RepID=A0A3F3QJU4_9EURO|nr:hypothetical protein BDQ94DRAFT_132718 [Aspergillus welwitschiae]RDH39239.1 hypothetical protein BDQ94DRAFT_132718 [Aspergillus welwitschiae]
MGLGLGLDLSPRFCVCSGLETVEPRGKGGGGERGESDGLIDEWWEGDSLST